MHGDDQGTMQIQTGTKQQNNRPKDFEMNYLRLTIYHMMNVRMAYGTR